MSDLIEVGVAREQRFQVFACRVAAFVSVGLHLEGKQKQKEQCGKVEVRHVIITLAENSLMQFNI